jgi:hypothetical protein
MYTTDQEIAKEKINKKRSRKTNTKTETTEINIDKDLQTILSKADDLKLELQKVYNKSPLKNLSDALIDIQMFCDKVKHTLN